jgi:hypothetical protein
LRNHVDRNVEIVSASAVDHAPQWRHVAEIPTHGQHDVGVADQAVVGRVQIHEAKAW